eukprot:2431085-Amphidinium_carterae.1
MRKPLLTLHSRGQFSGSTQISPYFWGVGFRHLCYRTAAFSWYAHLAFFLQVCQEPTMWCGTPLHKKATTPENINRCSWPLGLQQRCITVYDYTCKLLLQASFPNPSTRKCMSIGSSSLFWGILLVITDSSFHSVLSYNNLVGQIIHSVLSYVLSVTNCV